LRNSRFNYGFDDGLFERLRRWARNIKKDVIALYLCAKDRRVPWYAKAIAALVAAYALSPIDLIPDFVPVIGYLDDVIIVPLGIVLAVRLIPPEILFEHRKAAASWQRDHPASWAGAFLVIAIWLLTAVIVVRLMKSSNLF
jgi:uncharacterized membrane protein YkvA (DUF1232 family)